MRYLLLFLTLISSLYSNKFSLEVLKAEPPIAYVISNREYDDSELPQALQNGKDMKRFLEKYNFDVIYKENDLKLSLKN